MAAAAAGVGPFVESTCVQPWHMGRERGPSEPVHVRGPLCLWVQDVA